MSQPKCPECKRPASREQNRSFPFCSSRCRDVDLGRWLREEFRIPAPVTERDIDHLLQVAESEPGRQREE